MSTKPDGKNVWFSPLRAGAACAGAVLVIAIAAWRLWPDSQSHLHIAGTADKANQIDGAAAVGRDCTQAAMPSTEVTRVPAHGTVVFRQTRALPADLDRHAATLCPRRPLGGTIVFYDPKPGFHGVDMFAYTIAPEGGRSRNVAVEIDVK